jgi:hypothetical protein
MVVPKKIKKDWLVQNLSQDRSGIHRVQKTKKCGDLILLTPVPRGDQSWVLDPVLQVGQYSNMCCAAVANLSHFNITGLC